MELWNRQIKLAQYMLLGTVLVTVFNVAFLLGNVDMYISYSAALPYYLVWLGKVFDNGLYLGAANGEFTATGLLMAGVLLAMWLVLWWLARGSRKWLKVGMIAVSVDLAILVVLSIVLFSDPLSCLWEAVIHIAVIFEMAQGLKAWKERENALTRRETPPEEPLAEKEAPEEEPALEEEFV